MLALRDIMLMLFLSFRVVQGSSLSFFIFFYYPEATGADRTVLKLSNTDIALLDFGNKELKCQEQADRFQVQESRSDGG